MSLNKRMKLNFPERYNKRIFDIIINSSKITNELRSVLIETRNSSIEDNGEYIHFPTYYNSKLSYLSRREDTRKYTKTGLQCFPSKIRTIPCCKNYLDIDKSKAWTEGLNNSYYKLDLFNIKGYDKCNPL